MTCRGAVRLRRTQIPSTHAPADHRRFDGIARIDALPATATPSTQERDDISADVILAQELKRLLRRRYVVVNESIDSRLPCRHAMIRAGREEMPARNAARASWRAYMPPQGTESTSEDRMAFKPNYGRDRAERARAARLKRAEKQRKKDEKTALRKAERAEVDPPAEDSNTEA